VGQRLELVVSVALALSSALPFPLHPACLEHLPKRAWLTSIASQNHKGSQFLDYYVPFSSTFYASLMGTPE
jgi:hypothetical protein